MKYQFNKLSFLELNNYLYIIFDSIKNYLIRIYSKSNFIVYINVLPGFKGVPQDIPENPDWVAILIMMAVVGYGVYKGRQMLLKRRLELIKHEEEKKKKEEIARSKSKDDSDSSDSSSDSSS